MIRQVVVLLKKTVLLLLSAIAVFLFPAPARADAEPAVSAKSAVVVDADSGRILFAKNENERLPIASTTKIMTALLTLEAAAKEDREVTITDEMVRVEGSSMGLLPGDRLTLKALAEGMLSVSGNDAANSAAFAVAGSLKGFADLMNRRAAELKLTNTHFVTPSGLDDKNHYSSAYDMALLASAAMKNPDFAEIVGQKEIRVQYLNPDVTRRLTNHNKLLSMYDGCTGIKTGFTKQSGRCLVSSAERGGVRLIAVTLSDPNDWDDHERLLDYGFSRLKSVPTDDSSYRADISVVGGVSQSVQVTGCAGGSVVLDSLDALNLKRTVELPRFVYAPVRAGEVLGEVRYTVGTKTVAETELTACGNVAQVPREKGFFEKLWDNIRRLFAAAE